MGGMVLALILGAPSGVRGGDGAGEDPEAARQERQIRYLSAALAATQGDNDALRARLDGKVLESALSAVPGEEATRLLAGGVLVLDVNRELGMLVMEAGARQGVRAGMILMVMREKDSLARVRVTDVRRRVAGAVIEKLSAGVPYPGPGDRLVLMTDGK